MRVDKNQEKRRISMPAYLYSYVSRIFDDGERDSQNRSVATSPFLTIWTRPRATMRVSSTRTPTSACCRSPWLAGSFRRSRLKACSSAG